MTPRSLSFTDCRSRGEAEAKLRAFIEGVVIDSLQGFSPEVVSDYLDDVATAVDNAMQQCRPILDSERIGEEL